MSDCQPGRPASANTFLVQISFGLLTEEQRFDFQENLLKTMLQLEDTYFSLARTQTRNCLVI